MSDTPIIKDDTLSTEIPSIEQPSDDSTRAVPLEAEEELTRKEEVPLEKVSETTVESEVELGERVALEDEGASTEVEARKAEGHGALEFEVGGELEKGEVKDVEQVVEKPSTAAENPLDTNERTPSLDEVADATPLPPSPLPAPSTFHDYRDSSVQPESSNIADSRPPAPSQSTLTSPSAPSTLTKSNPYPPPATSKSRDSSATPQSTRTFLSRNHESEPDRREEREDSPDPLALTSSADPDEFQAVRPKPPVTYGGKGKGGAGKGKGSTKSKGKGKAAAQTSPGPSEVQVIVPTKKATSAQSSASGTVPRVEIPKKSVPSSSVVDFLGGGNGATKRKPRMSTGKSTPVVEIPISRRSSIVRLLVFLLFFSPLIFCFHGLIGQDPDREWILLAQIANSSSNPLFLSPSTIPTSSISRDRGRFSFYLPFFHRRHRLSSSHSNPNSGTPGHRSFWVGVVGH